MLSTERLIASAPYSICRAIIARKPALLFARAQTSMGDFSIRRRGWKRDRQMREACAGTKSVRGGGFTYPLEMEPRMPIRFDDLVDDVMSGAPQTIGVFLEFRMGCVGCPIACFHTVDDACREHGVDRDAFLAALSACA